MMVVGMIPARYAATRLPGKVLADICGKPMLRHVYERAARAATLSEVIIATDDERIAEAAAGFGARVEMTSPEHKSGTDRLAEVAQRLDCDVAVNIQGDEPLIDPRIIDRAVQPLLDDASVCMATLATRATAHEWAAASVVKVVCDARGDALYFSRRQIPYFRLDDPAQEAALAGDLVHPVSGCRPLKHIGLYVYRRETLLWYADLPRGVLEATESLEQLRVLENGCPIRVVEVDYSPVGVDTPEDLETVRRLVEAQL
ncbi:MAG: 3-deoxy-manno-octulosonate cytidylyltransferase [Armatimonadetes bacterium]|nr:3-deoxy-manno-octulosonate cytidylyltransferase [Armatimonadota bacterium]